MSWDNHSNNNGPWGNGPRRPKPRQDGPDIEDLIKKGQENFNKITGGGAGTPRGIALLVIFGLVLYMFSGVYRVLPDEQGVVLRFGAWVKTTEPGLNYHLPWPIETVFTPKVEEIQRVDVGAAQFDSFRRNTRPGSQSLPNLESLMLTGDENIVDIRYSVFWKIKDAGAFLFNLRNGDLTVKAVAESVMREVIGQTPIQAALTERKGDIEVAVKTKMQEILDDYEGGIEIRTVQLGQVGPPPQVVDAFDEVTRARQDLDRKKNEAEAYRNDIIPRARGEAEKMIQEAEAHREEIINRAEGDADRFLAVLKEYKVAKNVTRDRLYLETMEQILGNVNKIIVDEKLGSGIVPYLPLNELKKKSSNVSGLDRREVQ